MSCPNVPALKKRVIKMVLKKFNSLDKKKFPFELSKKNLTTEINKVKSKQFLNTLGAAKNSCAIRGGRYGKRGGGLLIWLLYILCIVNDEDRGLIEELINDYPSCYDLAFGDASPSTAPAATPAATPAAQPEVVTAAAPSAEDLPEAYAGLPTPEEVDAMSPEDYTNYINSLGGGRRRRKSRKKRRRKGRKTKRKSRKRKRKTKRKTKRRR